MLKIGEKDRDGRQKRIEYTGKHLRASRTGGVSLRAQTRVAGINVTGNTQHGVRLSARLARNTQVAMQNGRFVLRGRYGPDAAKVNLSKSGVSVSSKTPFGSFNWVHPGRSSFKFAGVQLRGHKAAYLQGIAGVFMLAIYLIIAALYVILFAIRGILWLATLPFKPLGWIAAWRTRHRAEAERLDYDLAEAAGLGRTLLERAGIRTAIEPARDLLAALTQLVVAHGRGEPGASGLTAALGAEGEPFAQALLADACSAAKTVEACLAQAAGGAHTEAALGLVHALASALGERLDGHDRAEVVFAIDDACLQAGPRTRLQEAMLETLAAGLGVELEVPRS